ncbi:RICIN domain-containing protein [Streptomyces otsuchiensis]|uniref:NHL domain-containing protein n=1 Tax=Streptomyces otsuchiensis TaxID=2681388 RepID=UPI00102FCBB7|nr:RICIN domain-containing protein [Streptomyces otsuchiensis]
MSTGPAVTTGGEHPAPPISTVAGTGAAGFKGHNEPALSAQLNRPYGTAVDSRGTLYVSDYSNHRIRKITTDGRISTVAGTGAAGFKGDNGPALSAQLNCPREVAVDSEGALYLADADNHRVRKVASDGTITTVAGTGTAGFSGDGGPATAARLSRPFGVAVDHTGVLYVAEYNNNRVRKIAADGTITTVAGTGAAGFRGDGGPAVSAQLNRPYGVAVDNEGGLYVVDAENHRVRKVAADGTISTVAGTGAAGFGGDGGPAVSAQLNTPLAAVVDSTGVLYVSDYRNHRVRKISPDGKVSTVAGTGAAGFGGDGGPAASAQLNHPLGLGVDCVDTLYITDYVNNRVRKIASPTMGGLPESGTVVAWANTRSRLRMAVVRESTKDGAEVQQSLAVPRDHQRWRLVAAGQENGDVLYMFENVRSGKVLEVAGAQEADGAVVTQRGYEGGDARHQQWRLIPVGSEAGDDRVYEIANRKTGLLLRVDTNARAVVRQRGADGDHRNRQWQLVPA